MDSKHLIKFENWNRIMLKLSGEVLIGNQKYGIDPDKVTSIAKDIAQVSNNNKQICIVVGGGNIFRGVSGASQGIDRVTADGMGMLATVINALALQNAIEKQKIPTRVLSAIPMQTICEPFIKRRAIRHLNKGRIIILAAGTGNPKVNSLSKKFSTISYKKVLSENLKVMDSSAISLARDNNIPMVVFSILEKNAFEKAVKGQGSYTVIMED